MEKYIQILMAMGGTVGFSLMFHVKKKQLIPCAIGGALAWILYLLALSHWGSISIAILAATAVVGFAAEGMARIFKAPAITFLVPMLVTLIPGGDLYRATSFLVRQDMIGFAHQLQLLLKEAGAIALGIILVACVMHLPRKIVIHKKG